MTLDRYKSYLRFSLRLCGVLPSTTEPTCVIVHHLSPDSYVNLPSVFTMFVPYFVYKLLTYLGRILHTLVVPGLTNLFPST